MTHTESTQTLRRRWPRWLKPVARIGGALVATGSIVALLLMIAGVFHEKVPDVVPDSVGSRAADGASADVRLVKRSRFETAIGTIKLISE